MRAPDHEREVERLQALYSYDILDTPAESDFDEIVQLASDICGVPISLISLVDRDRQWFKARRGLEIDQTPRDQAICGYTLGQDDYLEIEDTTKDARTAENALVATKDGLRFYAGVKLTNADGLPIGTLCVLSREPHALNDMQRNALRVLARQVMQQIELRRALRRHDVLRREIDHRVKNSLTMVNSVVRLYGRKMTDPLAQEGLAAIERRIGAVSALHEALHRTHALERVPMRDLMQDIVRQLEITAPEGVSITADIADLDLSSGEANAVAVIASEAAANSFKHAFTGREGGTVTISLAFDPDGTVRLDCRDDGQADPGAGDPIASLGQQLMEASAQQLGGTLRQGPDAGGYAVTLTFRPVRAGPPRE